MAAASSRREAGSHGKFETEQLKQNIRDQQNRLLQQLEDIEELKAEFDNQEEYEETKKETLAMLHDFQALLDRTLSGDLSLVDEFGSVQLAIQAAISEAFKTPAIIRMFAEKQPAALRKHLNELQVLSRDQLCLWRNAFPCLAARLQNQAHFEGTV